jgi:AhpD family alkylhydroperoxidase
MKPRLNYVEHSNALARKLMEFGALFNESSLTRTMLDLVNIRASQINGCAFCLDMHVKEAKIHGERELRLYHVSIWEESPLFTDKERAALQWTEALTKLTGKIVPEETYQEVRKHLSEKEISDLSFAVAIINSWNRLNAGFVQTPGALDAMFGLNKAGLN